MRVELESPSATCSVTRPANHGPPRNASQSSSGTNSRPETMRSGSFGSAVIRAARRRRRARTGGRGPWYSATASNRCLRRKSGHSGRSNHELGVGQLPEEEVRDAHLAAGADQQVRVGQARGVEVGARTVASSTWPASTGRRAGLGDQARARRRRSRRGRCSESARFSSMPVLPARGRRVASIAVAHGRGRSCGAADHLQAHVLPCSSVVSSRSMRSRKLMSALHLAAGRSQFSIENV